LNCYCITCILGSQLVNKVGKQNNPLVFPSVVVIPPIIHFASILIASFTSSSNLITDSWIVIGPISVYGDLGSPKTIFSILSANIGINFYYTYLWIYNLRMQS